MKEKRIREMRYCPPEFQERLTRMFGVNKFGDPLYRFAWAQTETQKMGFSAFSERGTNCGYRDKLKGSSTPCWMLLRWKDPSHYGSPDLYYANSWMDDGEEGQGFYVTAEYPWKGRYEVLYMMCSKEFKNGELFVHALPLNHGFIDKVIPLLIESQYLTAFERQAAKQMEKEYHHRQEVNELADRMMNDLPAWYGPVSYSSQGCRTALLDRKMQEIQRKWEQLSLYGRPVFSRGMMQGSRPIIQARA